jgi:hypothetical protein
MKEPIQAGVNPNVLYKEEKNKILKKFTELRKDGEVSNFKEVKKIVKSANDAALKL